MPNIDDKTKEIPVSVKYRAGHTIEDNYALTNLHCLNCGNKTVYVELGAGDYYQGPTHVCITCNTDFTNPSLNTGENQSDDDGFNSTLQIVDQIKKFINN